MANKLLLAFFQADRVENPLALKMLKPDLQYGPPGTVDHDGDTRYVRLRGHQIQERGHGLFGVEHPFIHVHVEDVRAILHLLSRHHQGLLVVALQYQPGETRRPCYIGSLTDDHEAGLGTDGQRLQPAETSERFHRRDRPGLKRGHSRADSRNVRRSGATTPANDVEPTILGKLAQYSCHVLRRFVVSGLRKRVGQPGIRVAAREDGGDRRKLFDVRSHLRPTQRTVDPHAEEIHVTDGVPEPLNRLS